MITSPANPLVKRIKRLGHKKYRRLEGAFFVEGILPVLSALQSQAQVEELVYAPELLHSPAALQAVQQFQAQGGSCTAVSASVFAAVSGRDNPVGLGAIVHLHLLALSKLDVKKSSLFVALDRVSDPGNLGAIVRTVDAAGAQGVILLGSTVDPFHPAAVKASMGALFTVPLATAQGVEAVWPWARTCNLFTVATSARATTGYQQADYRFPLLLLLGNEGEGLGAADLRAADCAVTIPMQGTASSLNLAVAAGLLLYELAHARAVGGEQ